MFNNFVLLLLTTEQSFRLFEIIDPAVIIDFLPILRLSLLQLTLKKNFLQFERSLIQSLRMR